jgi:HPt (histidine-containing phosphotransfer) domain-containing protein
MSNEKPTQPFDATVLDDLNDAIGDGINHIISIYVDDFPNSILTMRNGLKNEEFETIGRIAHSLKSSSGNLGALQLSYLSATLEHMIRNGTTEEIVLTSAIDELESAFQQVQPRLISYIR